MTAIRQSERAPRHAPPIAVLVVLALLLLAPMVILSFTAWHANSSLWYLGMLPAVIGLFKSPRLGFAAAVLTPLLMGLSLLLRDFPIVGALYMAALAVATGFSALRGWQLMLSFAAPLTSFALIGDINVALPSGTVAASSSVAAGLVLVGFALAGGLWTAVLGQFVVRAVPMKPPKTFPLRTSAYFAAALGVLVGVSTFVAMTVLDSDSWWIILTFFVVVQPLYSDATKRAISRAVGTLVGALVAVVIASVFQSSPGVITIVALVLTVAAALANMKLPYWVFVIFLTPAVVLQTEGGSPAIDHAIFERAMYTLVGVAAAVVVLSIGHVFVTRRERDREDLVSS